MPPMGAAMQRFPVLTDGDRARLAATALREGTAARIRAVQGWSADDLAQRCNVTTHLLAAWEQGTEAPSLASALKVWDVLVAACREDLLRAL